MGTLLPRAKIFQCCPERKLESDVLRFGRRHLDDFLDDRSLTLLSPSCQAYLPAPNPSLSLVPSLSSRAKPFSLPRAKPILSHLYLRGHFTANPQSTERQKPQCLPS